MVLISLAVISSVFIKTKADKENLFLDGLILFPKFDLNYNTYVTYILSKRKKGNHCKHSNHLNI
jgi:hypothetical protein